MKTLKDLETYLLDTNGMERGQDPVLRAIMIMETLVKALHERGAIRSLTPSDEPASHPPTE